MTALPAIGTYLRPVGRQCPIRQGYGHRKVRAGQPVRDDTGCLPVQYTQEQLDQWRKQIDREAVELWIIVACLVMLVLIVLGVMTGVV
jgi:sensor histidine kinase regulating citrate/malate metabolism